MKVNVYESVSFKCTIYGYGDLKIMWRRKKYNIPVTAKITE